jgi:hypothetical protein
MAYGLVNGKNPVAGIQDFRSIQQEKFLRMRNSSQQNLSTDELNIVINILPLYKKKECPPVATT